MMGFENKFLNNVMQNGAHFCMKEKTVSNTRPYEKVGRRQHSSISPGERSLSTPTTWSSPLTLRIVLKNSGLCSTQSAVLCCSGTSKLMQYFEQLAQMKVTFHRRLTMLKKVVFSVGKKKKKPQNYNQQNGVCERAYNGHLGFQVLNFIH